MSRATLMPQRGATITPQPPRSFVSEILAVIFVIAGFVVLIAQAG